MAVIIGLLDETLIRIGNAEYERQNGSYGLTTLHNSHVRVHGDELRFRFRGKGGKEHRVLVRDRRLARAVRRCQELPGGLFQYMNDDGDIRPVGSGDVNAFLIELTGQDFTAKDFRTWGGSVGVAQALIAEGPRRSEQGIVQAISRAVEAVAAQLGNTPRICRSCYVHPAIIEAYRDGSLFDAWQRVQARPSKHPTQWTRKKSR